MTEGTLKSADPFLYFVNNISDFDIEIVKAFRNNDSDKKKQLLDVEKNDFDVFICINKGYHAFVLCSAVPSVADKLQNLGPEMSEDPFDIPGVLLVWQFELTFENEESRTYKIKKRFDYFKNVKDRVHRSYYVGRYRGVSVRALQFAALSASPKRYRVMLDDCVEFAKAFCVELLSHCSNWRKLERHVDDQIQKATASGLSAEQLSRRIKSSAVVMNTFLGGMDTTTLFSGQRYGLLLLVFLILYPIVVAVVVTLVIVSLYK